MIRVGEKILQKVGAKLPMVWGGIITTIGVAMMGLTFLPDFAYTVVVFIGFALFGLGLGIYATPSTDTSVSNAPSDKVGEAAGVYKMASSLGVHLVLRFLQQFTVPSQQMEILKQRLQ